MAIKLLLKKTETTPEHEVLINECRIESAIIYKDEITLQMYGDTEIILSKEELGEDGFNALKEDLEKEFLPVSNSYGANVISNNENTSTT